MSLKYSYYIDAYEGRHLMCAPRGCRLSENGYFIIESNFDEDENFFVYIPVYILIELMIDMFSTFMSASSMN